MKTNDKNTTKSNPFFAKLLEKQITNANAVKGGNDTPPRDWDGGPGKGVDFGDANGNPVTMKAPSDHDEAVLDYLGSLD